MLWKAENNLLIEIKDWLIKDFILMFLEGLADGIYEPESY